MVLCVRPRKSLNTLPELFIFLCRLTTCQSGECNHEHQTVIRKCDVRSNGALLRSNNQVSEWVFRRKLYKFSIKNHIFEPVCEFGRIRCTYYMLPTAKETSYLFMAKIPPDL